MAKIALLLTPDFADWEYAMIAGAGRSFYGLDVRFFAPQSGELVSAGGLHTLVAHDFGAVGDWQADAVIVVGGNIWGTEDAPDIGNMLRSEYARGTTIAGICGGTLALAKAGMLNEVNHTSNARDFLTLNAPSYKGQDHYVDQPFAQSHQRIITAAGTAPASFAAAVFTSVGVDKETTSQFSAMMAAEHGASLA